MSARKQSEQDLEIERDPVFQRREWTVQRVGWGLMALIILAGLAGAFGEGLLARTGVTSPDGSLRVHYDRIARNETVTALRISVRGAAISDGTVRLWLDRQYLENMPIERLTPEPDSVSTDATRFRFFFGVGPGADSAMIHIHLQPVSMGTSDGAVGVDDGATVLLRQYILP